MSQETRLYREFAKAFARKLAYVLCWTAIIGIALLLVLGVMYVATVIAWLLLSVTGVSDTHPFHLAVTIGVLAIFAGILKIADSAWQEAKSENKEESEP